MFAPHPDPTPTPAATTYTAPSTSHVQGLGPARIWTEVRCRHLRENLLTTPKHHPSYLTWRSKMSSLLLPLARGDGSLGSVWGRDLLTDKSFSTFVQKSSVPSQR